MRVLVTGHDGYIGRSLVPMLAAAGHEVVGLDSYLYRGCDLDTRNAAPEPDAIELDVRDVERRHLAGFDAVIHLAGLSNDPLGDLDERLTYEINHEASVRLAEVARAAGVERFLFSSSCSNYGAAKEGFRTEESECNPITTYGISKVLSEQDIAALAGPTFHPVFLRNATAYGVTERLRGDLVVNNLVAYAWATGEILMKSDGTPWRPLVHVEDIARAFTALLPAPIPEIHNEVFNIGDTDENYRVRDVAEIVGEVVPDTQVAFATGAMADFRDYRVDCSKFLARFPAGRPRWTVRRGVEQLYAAYRASGRQPEELLGPSFLRIDRIRQQLESGELDETLRRAGTARPRSGRDHAAA